jgi:hypothetical protein
MHQIAPLTVIAAVSPGTSTASAACCSFTDVYISNKRGSLNNSNPFSILFDSFDNDRYELIKSDDRHQ